MVYKAARDYGSRNSEINKKIIQFGDYTVTIYQRADLTNSSYYFRVWIREEGRNYRQSLNTTDPVAAEKAVTHEMIKTLRRVDNGEKLLALELKDLVRKFKLDCEAKVESNDLAKTTWMNHLSRIHHGVEFLKTKYKKGLETKLTEIDGKVFMDYLAFRLAENEIARRSLRKDVARDELLIIRKLFKFGLEKGMLSEKNMPKWDIRVEKEGPKRERMTAKDFKEFFDTTLKWMGEAETDTASYHRTMAMNVILFVATSGMRSGEVFGLKNKDLQKRGDAECLVNIRAETSKVRMERQIIVRTLGLNNWLKTQKYKDPNDFVFSPHHGGKTSCRDTFYHMYKSLRIKLKEINLEWMDLYHMRHWWISNRLLAEEPIHLVAVAAGTSVREIEATYSHVMSAITTKRFNRKEIVHYDDGDYQIIEEQLKKI